LSVDINGNPEIANRNNHCITLVYPYASKIAYVT
jgi:hypothetical protein